MPNDKQSTIPSFCARATEPSAKISALPVDTVAGSSNTASAPERRADSALKYLSIMAGSPL